MLLSKMQLSVGQRRTYRQTPHKAVTFLGAFSKLRKATISFVRSVRSHKTTRLPMDGFSWNFVWGFFENLSRNFKFYKNLTRITGTWRHLYICDNTSLHSCYNKKYFRQSCRQNQNAHFMFNDIFLKNPAFYEMFVFFFWRYNPLWLYFHSPVAGFSLPVFEVSWSHKTTCHSR